MSKVWDLQRCFEVVESHIGDLKEAGTAQPAPVIAIPNSLLQGQQQDLVRRVTRYLKGRDFLALASGRGVSQS